MMGVNFDAQRGNSGDKNKVTEGITVVIRVNHV